MKNLALVTCLSASALFLNACSQSDDEHRYKSDKHHNKVVKALGDIPERTELDQNWDYKTRMDFWFTSQGSRVVPYDWFTWLEMADSDVLFRDSAHMEELRYLPYKASSMNPSGLPIGFAIDKDENTGRTWMGLTCAACHTNQIDYGAHKLLVEGAPTLANYVQFFNELVDALNATHQDDAKFDRFAENVLGKKYSEKHAKQLRSDLLQWAVFSATRRDVNALPESYPKDFTSYGRLDAFGNIQNEGTAFALNDLSNSNPPTGPVSYPFLWGTHQSDVVQWNASAPNTPVVGPLARNIGEVVGVFGNLRMHEVDAGDGAMGQGIKYTSTTNMIALGHLESWVKDLRSPQWPEEVFPKIDTNQAAQGAILYSQHCQECHQVIERKDENQLYKAVRTPVAEVGTDPITAVNAAHHQAKTLFLEGSREQIIVGDRFKSTAPSISVAVNGALGIALEEPLVALKAGLIPIASGDDDGHAKALAEMPLKAHLGKHLTAQANYRSIDIVNSAKAVKKPSDANLIGLVYKARPLNGIWATAPYLHNGSIPSLWELLQTPEERVKSFWVGSRQFDPKSVGFVTDTGLSEFKVLNAQGTIQPGNSNLGHDYGTQLNDEQKWALVEYMKTL